MDNKSCAESGKRNKCLEDVLYLLIPHALQRRPPRTERSKRMIKACLLPINILIDWALLDTGTGMSPVTDILPKLTSMTTKKKNQNPGCKIKQMFHDEIYFQVDDYISTTVLFLNLWQIQALTL